MSFVDACEVDAVDPERVAAARQALISLGEAASLAESFKLLGDPTEGYPQGRTMRNSASLGDLRYERQSVEEDIDSTSVITRLVSPRG